MVKCNNCGKELKEVEISVFNYDGSDSTVKEEIEEVPENAVLIRTNPNWCGYELDEEEQIEDIQCPYCKKFPFKVKEVQVYNVVHIVCFKE